MTTRLIALNNPTGILRTGDEWQGMSLVQPDKEMVSFIGPEWSLRAQIKIWLSYRKRGVVTLEAIVSAHCPPKHTLPGGKVVRNNTPAYIAFVAGKLGLPYGTPAEQAAAKSTVLNVTQRPVLRLMLPAFVQQENAQQPYPASVFEKAMDLALIAKDPG